MVLMFIDIFSKGFCTTCIFVWCQFVCVRTFRASGQNILTLALTMLTEFLLYLIIWKSLTNYQSVLWKSFISHLLLLLLIFFLLFVYNDCAFLIGVNFCFCIFCCRSIYTCLDSKLIYFCYILAFVDCFMEMSLMDYLNSCYFK